MNTERSILLTVSYDGRDFCGFAPQKEQRTIASELLGALQAVDPRIREVRGASRTDAGVHAKAHPVAFDPSRDIPTRGWVLATNRHLPDAISIKRAVSVPRGFVPRFESLYKRYRYVLLCEPLRDPFWTGRAWRVPAVSPDALLGLRDEANAATGTHDFRAFRSSQDERTETHRTIRSIVIEVGKTDVRTVSIAIEGNAFMHNMVRILVGTMLDIACGRKPPGTIAKALSSGLRSDAGTTAPPDGLYLEHVELTHPGEDAWPPSAGASLS